MLDKSRQFGIFTLRKVIKALSIKPPKNLRNNTLILYEVNF